MQPAALMGSSLADWISAISQLIFLVIFILLFVGANQRLQVYVWKGDIKSKLGVIEWLATGARKRAREYIAKNKGRDVDRLLERTIDFFLIEPVSVEPTDIIKRMDHLFNVRRLRFKDFFKQAMSEADDVTRSRAEVAVEVASALNYIYKIVRHLLMYGEKTKNWILIMQLQLVMPMILQQARTLWKAQEHFLKGVPIGDGAGPLVAVRLAGEGAEWREVDDETVASEVDLEGRRLIIVKAKGPASSVGRPGRATERIVRDLVGKGVKPALLLTVDAALKLEGEETGSIAEGVGAAIGDPGPEKIRFERIAAEYDIPLRALAIKMSEEEAITAMNEKIYKAIDKAVERAKTIILQETRPGDTVILVGVGNTAGIAQ
ncbi:MAG: DUF1512 domain-containing protein [Desulfurococcales archaeon]|nr:DUF1512 domain-containing protein [Desulfurococcales archaeon]